MNHVNNAVDKILKYAIKNLQNTCARLRYTSNTFEALYMLYLYLLFYKSSLTLLHYKTQHTYQGRQAFPIFYNSLIGCNQFAPKLTQKKLQHVTNAQVSTSCYNFSLVFIYEKVERIHKSGQVSNCIEVTIIIDVLNLNPMGFSAQDIIYSGLCFNDLNTPKLKFFYNYCYPNLLKILNFVLTIKFSSILTPPKNFLSIIIKKKLNKNKYFKYL
ncbi:hypothetical protein AGLY_014408 [Aphis glycines]|uniref:Uncharacterized protein n=1 Tax=Aphis glycines TaxID=307491 RepID=A0A6G0T4P3_APHGL|nr:hypothetical protein AGLY_014408 [Aphis glycines]